MTDRRWVPTAGLAALVFLVAGTASIARAAEDLVVLRDPALVTVTTAAADAPVRTILSFGRVVANPTAARDINATIGGQIENVQIRSGSVVKKGDLVASVSSPDFVFTQRSYLALLGNEERLAILKEEGNLPNFINGARENLKWWGMDEQSITDLEKSGKIVETLSILAPADGIITNVLVRPGDVIDAGDRTMQKFVVLGRAIATMVTDGVAPILEVNAYVDGIAAIEPDATRVRLKPAGGAQQELPVSYVLPDVDPATQAGRAVVDLEGAGVRLTLGETMPVDLLLPAEPGVWIPTATILRQRLTPVVFVQQSADRFERRRLDIVEIVGEWARVSNVQKTEKLAKNGKTILEGAYRMQQGDPAEAGAAHSHH